MQQISLFKPMLDMSKKMIRWALTSNDPTQSNTKSVFIVTTNCWIICSSVNHEFCSLRFDKPQGLGWVPRYL